MRTGGKGAMVAEESEMQGRMMERGKGMAEVGGMRNTVGERKGQVVTGGERAPLHP